MHFFSLSLQIPNASIVSWGSVCIKFETIAQCDFMGSWDARAHGVDVVGIAQHKVFDGEAHGESDRLLGAVVDAEGEEVVIHDFHSGVELGGGKVGHDADRGDELKGGKRLKLEGIAGNGIEGTVGGEACSSLSVTQCLADGLQKVDARDADIERFGDLPEQAKADIHHHGTLLAVDDQRVVALARDELPKVYRTVKEAHRSSDT